MTPLTTIPGTWQRELQRSRQSLSAVNQFWQGLYGKAVLDRDAARLLSPSGSGGRSPASDCSMYERVGSRVTNP